MLYEKFRHGINLGGWLSQYEIITESKSEEKLSCHFDSFITEENIRQIAEWGFDHIRVPVDGYLFYDRELQRLKEAPLHYLDLCVGWCEKYHLNIIIDLHNIWGHIYGAMDQPVPFLTDQQLRDHFLGFWREMTIRYKNELTITVMFELFNEVADATGYLWNSLYKQTIKAIREIDKKRFILVGSNYINSVVYLDRLDLVDDDYVFYNFHFYEPNVFTHQRAHFSEEFNVYKYTLTYPGDLSEYQEFLKKHPEYIKDHPFIIDEKSNDQALMEKMLEYAVKFLRYSGKELYCSEFGVIDSAPEEEAVKWLQDFITSCDSLKIGHCMWNYKCLDFELIDGEGTIVRPKVLTMLKGEENQNIIGL